jgi:hypothetical protein
MKLLVAFRNFANAPKTTVSEKQQERMKIPRSHFDCLLYADACSACESFF